MLDFRTFLHLNSCFISFDALFYTYPISVASNDNDDDDDDGDNDDDINVSKALEMHLPSKYGFYCFFP